RCSGVTIDLHDPVLVRNADAIECVLQKITDRRNHKLEESRSHAAMSPLFVRHPPSVAQIGGEDLVELGLPTGAHIPSITIVLACSKAGRYSKIFTPASSRGPHGLDERGEDIVSVVHH